MIYLGTDHVGFEIKERLKEFLSELGYQVEDCGNFVYDQYDDYPDFIRPVAEAVARDPENSMGIILGGSGQGEAMMANRIKGVRATVIYNYNEDIICLSKDHNNANVISLSARFLSEQEIKQAIKLWLETSFSGEERHCRRIGKLDK
ncbi:MAG: RpiB/LacA/LacB family sugar-phosphate isomerase [Candidatus Falkowbacteria bacterium]